MGMFDELRSEYPLPAPNAQGLKFQTKSTNCNLDMYLIRPDGSLHMHGYEDAEFEENYFTGEIQFYDYSEGTLAFSAYFKRGILQQVNLLEDKRTPPTTNSAPATSTGESDTRELLKQTVEVLEMVVKRMKDTPAVQGREFNDLGIQVNNAIRAGRLHLEKTE